MQDNHSLHEWDRSVVWHGFTQMAEYEPFIIERAEGCMLMDIAGQQYIDGASSLWCNIHGHRHPKIDAAIRQQLDKIAHFTNLGGSNPTTILLAKRLVDIAPKDLRHVFFAGDGASAVEAAIKMAFQYWRQRKNPKPEKNSFLALGQGYHGDTIGSVSVSGIDLFHKMFSPLLFKTIRVPAPDSYRTPPGVSRENMCEYHLGILEKTLAEHHEHIAAMIIEPLVQAAAGLIMHPPGYLRGARELTRKYDVLMIADEVAVGFGRTGKMFACEHESVAPDLLCLGKGLTGGYLAMSAALATVEIWQAFLGSYDECKTFFHGHTYGGNPLAAAAGLATLDVFEEERTLENLTPKINRLREHLSDIAEMPHVGNVRQCGLIAGIELVKNKETKEPYSWQERRGAQVCDFAQTEGVWIRPLGDTIVILPPLAITINQIDAICRAIKRGIEQTSVE